MAKSGVVAARNRSTRDLPTDLGPNKPTERLAGGLYLLLAVGSGCSLTTLGHLVVPGDAAASLQNILEHGPRFRLALLGDVVGQTAFALMAPVLFALFQPVQRAVAQALALLILVSVPIALASVAPLLALASLAHPQAGEADLAQAATLLELRTGGIAVAQVFWGLWLLPLGWLTYRCGFMPKLLGPAVALGSVAYLLDSVGRLLFPDGGPLAAVVPACMVVSTVAELAMVGWLLFFGIREPASAPPAAAHAA